MENLNNFQETPNLYNAKKENDKDKEELHIMQDGSVVTDEQLKKDMEDRENLGREYFH